MKRLIVGLLMCIPLQIVSGQDKIITIQNDTIYCRIVSVSSTRIQYEQRVENQYVVGKFIPREQVLEYYQDPQSVEINSYYRTERQKSKPSHRFLVGAQVGASFLMKSSIEDKKKIMDNMGMSESQEKDYYNQLKRGWHLHGDIHYMESDNFGLGVKYSFFTSSAQKDFIMNLYGEYLPTYVCVGLKEKQYIHYAGPSVFFRQWLGENKKFQLAETFSMGYVRYRDELRMDATFNLDNALIKGSTWGANCGMSLDYFPKSCLSIGANVGFMYARLTKLHFSDKESTQTVELPKEYYQSLSRLDCSISIHYHFN